MTAFVLAGSSEKGKQTKDSVRVLRLSKNLPAEGFGGKDGVEENRQGFLSRAISTNIKTILDVLIFAQLVKQVQKDLLDKLKDRQPIGPAVLFLQEFRALDRFGVV